MQTYDKHRNGTLSRYTVTEMDRGFLVHGLDRPTVTVRLEDDHTITVEAEAGAMLEYGEYDQPDEGPHLGSSHRQRSVSHRLYDFRGLLSSISTYLMAEWAPTSELVVSSEQRAWIGAKTWAIKQTQGVLRTRVYYQWRRLQGLLPPSVLQIHNKIFAACFKRGPHKVDPRLIHVERWPELYQRPHLVEDIIEYRAAATVAGRWWDFPAMMPNVVRDESASHESVDRSLILDALEGWRDLFSPTGSVYVHLQSTLENLPGGVPSRLLPYLSVIMLERPILDRLELTLLLAAVHGSYSQPVHCPPNLSPFMHATGLEITKAMDYMSRHLPLRFQPGKAQSVQAFYNWVSAGLDGHNGSLLELCDKAIVRHDEYTLAPHADVLAYHSSNEEIAAPPIDLARLTKQHPEVKFLATVAGIVEAAKTMHPIILKYITHARLGACYLFHVEYKGERACAVLDPRGGIVAVYVQGIITNRAERYARQVLPKIWK